VAGGHRPLRVRCPAAYGQRYSYQAPGQGIDVYFFSIKIPPKAVCFEEKIHLEVEKVEKVEKVKGKERFLVIFEFGISVDSTPGT
jgi:hypothetical protein